MDVKKYPSWDKTKAYKKYDIVVYLGALYAALKDVPANTRIDDTSEWLLIYKNQAFTNHERYQNLMIEKASETGGGGGGDTVTYLVARQYGQGYSSEEFIDPQSTYEFDLWMYDPIVKEGERLVCIVMDYIYDIDPVTHIKTEYLPIYMEAGYPTFQNTYHIILYNPTLQRLRFAQMNFTFFIEKTGQVGGGGGGGSVAWDDVTDKPAGLVIDDSYVHTDNNFTTPEKDKLSALVDIESIGSGLVLDNGELRATGGGGSSIFILDTNSPCTPNEFLAAFGMMPVYVKYNNALYYTDTYWKESNVYSVYAYKSSANQFEFMFEDNGSDDPFGFVNANQRAIAARTFIDGSVATGLKASITENNNRIVFEPNTTDSDVLDFLMYRAINVQQTRQIPTKEYVDSHSKPLPAYDVSENDVGGNVLEKGTILINGVTYGIYEFYYHTDSLPNTTTQTFSLTTLLADYTIKDFVDATGVTSNGIFIGNGRTDNDNRLIVQQFSKNNKTITLRTYQNFTGNTALLKVLFIGTKNA